MALKADRKYTVGTDVSYFMNTTGERGGIVIHSTGGSGISMDDANAVVAYPTVGASVSGTYPAGLLLCDVVNLDLTRTHINWHKDEVQVGGKVTLLRQGQVVTNKVSDQVNPTVGQAAYYNDSGNLTTVRPTDGTLEDSVYQVGRFLSRKDADGYVKVEINIH